MSKHHLPDDDTLDPTTHQSWLAEISRADDTIDTPRHLFWGGIKLDADDSPTVDLTLLTRERQEPELTELPGDPETVDESSQLVKLATVIPLRPETPTPSRSRPRKRCWPPARTTLLRPFHRSRQAAAPS